MNECQSKLFCRFNGKYHIGCLEKSSGYSARNKAVETQNDYRRKFGALTGYCGQCEKERLNELGLKEKIESFIKSKDISFKNLLDAIITFRIKATRKGLS